MISSLKITDILNISGDFGHLYGELSKTENGYEFIGENISLNIIEEEYDFGVVKELKEGETRVAITPDVVAISR